ncbi:MAG: PaaI family thioesterase [Candidatus Acidiferrales bacterium]|jgi:uncharacterized protein (TIGR00369 family)
MSGRKLNLREVREVLREISFSKMLGIRISHLHRDGITIECDVRKSFLNNAGSLHGGVSAALADVAVGVAVYRHLGSHRPITTVEMKINYFRPVTEGRIFARSQLLRIGSTLCIGRVDITDAKSQSVGTALVTYMLIGAPQTVSA